MKKMLITGASRGIGAAIAEEFASDYNVVTVARTGAVTFQEDLLNEGFLQLLMSIDFDVVVNNAGTSQSDFTTINQLNYMIPARLTEHFYFKMSSGFIFNITSNAAHEQGQWMRFVPQSGVAYYASKRALKGYTNLLADSALNPNVKLISVEPMLCRTDMVANHEEVEKRLHFIEPSDVAKLIRSTMELPDRLQMNSIHIKNKRKTRQ